MNFISSKINVIRIFKSHNSTSRNSGKMNKADVWTFYIIPFIIAFSLCLVVDIAEDFIGLLGIILTIFIGLFLNLLMLLISYVPPKEIEENKRALLVKTKKETFYNVSYIILMSIIELFFLLVFVYIQDIRYISYIFNFILYALTIHIFLILLMILKRVFSLYDNTI